MVMRPASISARLVALTCDAERPSASCCMDDEGQTIGRPPLPQSCGWVNLNSQSMACTRRGASPSLGAAAFRAASTCPGTVTPSGSPSKACGGAVDLQQARRQSAKAGRGTGKASPLRPKGAFRLHRDPPFGWIATGKPRPLAEIG